MKEKTLNIALVVLKNRANEVHQQIARLQQEHAAIVEAITEMEQEECEKPQDS